MVYNKYDKRGAKMTFEQIENDVDKIIFEMKNCIAAEECSNIKTSNYEIYKTTLADAIELKANITTAKKNNSPTGILESELELLKCPIY